MQTTPKRPPRTPRPAKPASPPSARRPLGPRPTTVALVERIVELQVRQVPLDTFAAAMTPLRNQRRTGCRPDTLFDPSRS